MASIAIFPWYALQVASRSEKAVASGLEMRGYSAFLPLFRSRRKWSDRFQDIDLPLFPGYVFLRINNGDRQKVRQSDYVANLLEVFDQRAFEQQLQDILLALDSGVGVRLAPAIGVGMRVRIKGGPLQGIEGWVESRYGMTTVLLRLDFINQAAAVKLEADLLKPI